MVVAKGPCREIGEDNGAQKRGACGWVLRRGAPKGRIDRDVGIAKLECSRAPVQSWDRPKPCSRSSSRTRKKIGGGCSREWRWRGRNDASHRICECPGGCVNRDLVAVCIRHCAWFLNTRISLPRATARRVACVAQSRAVGVHDR